MAEAVVFLGPSLPRDEARAIVDAASSGAHDIDIRPPVAQGDVVRAVEGRPLVLCLIDGYFERQPAVWHKEILWALSRRIHVVGAASMGALRAAELERFGMVGVGSIFQAFRDGLLQDDDEVALAHGPAESGYRAASEAMVDLRATLGAALSEGVIDAAVGRRLEAEAKRRDYPERRWPAIVLALRSDDPHDAPPRDDDRSDDAELDRFVAWLDAGGRVEQKRLDAERALRHVAELLERTERPPRPAWRFQHTLAWHELRRDALGGES